MVEVGQPRLFDAPSAFLTLADRFLVPPFSVLEARAGYWQERKNQWLALGIQGEVRPLQSADGRKGNLLGMSETVLAAQAGQNPARQREREALEAEIAATRSSQSGAAPSGREPSLTFGGGIEEDTYYRRERERAVAVLREMHSCSEEEAQARWEAQEAASPRNGGSLQSGAGRNAALLTDGRDGFGQWDTAKGESAWGGAGTSIFDPVLCELAYRWWSAPGAAILDPFAGGSVRGIVAGALGRRYLGIDLRPEQIAANEAQRAALSDHLAEQPRWHCGDSRALPDHIGAERFDFAFSCPPYFDLEQYSDDPADLSNAGDYAKFRIAYQEIIWKTIEALKPDRFACFVVGEVRDKAGIYHGFVPDTIRCFQAAGAAFYNEIILVTAVGSLPIRTSRIFGAGRKTGKTHQNVLVFVKGDPKRAAAACGPIGDVAIEYGGAAVQGDVAPAYDPDEPEP